MTSFVKRFRQWIVALAVVGGLYLAAFAVKKLWAFWSNCQLSVSQQYWQLSRSLHQR